MKGLPLKLKIFISFMLIFTVLSVSFFTVTKSIPFFIPNYLEVLFFSVILALGESFVVHYRNVAVSTSFAIHLASIILFGPISAIIIAVLGFSLRIVKHDDKYVHILNTPLYKTLYNYCAIIIPTFFGGLIYLKIEQTILLHNTWVRICLVVAFSSVYFLLNTFLLSALFSIISNKSIVYFFKSNSKLSILSIVIMAPFGMLLAYIFERYKLAGVMLILFPIILVRYTFSLYIEAKTQYIQTVDTLMHAMEARDKYTEGHSQRVAEIAELIAKQLKYNDSKIERLHMAALLHDVGKIGIDDNILNKPGRLTQEEYQIIKSHPEIGYNILKDVKNLEDILSIIRNHHERYDGKGYPDGKNADELGLEVFIIQLADSIDAMATDRPYRKALSHEQVLDEIIKYKGTQFHPTVVEAYLNVIQKQKKVV